MVDRILLGHWNGDFVARVSRPGFDVKTAGKEGFLFREDTISMKPGVTGQAVFTGSGTQVFSLGGAYSELPFVILKSSDFTIPSLEGYDSSIDQGLANITIRNHRPIARTIYFFVFGGTQLDP